MKTDSLFYRLFQEQPGLVFELADWPVPAGVVYTLRAEEIQRMLHLPDVELKQTRFYQDVFAEGRTEGHAEGRTEGQQQEAAALVLRLLRRRLGAVPTDVESRIRALPVAELEALGEALLDWHTPAELMAWLQRQG